MHFYEDPDDMFSRSYLAYRYRYDLLHMQQFLKLRKLYRRENHIYAPDPLEKMDLDTFKGIRRDDKYTVWEKRNNKP